MIVGPGGTAPGVILDGGLTTGGVLGGGFIAGGARTAGGFQVDQFGNILGSGVGGGFSAANVGGFVDQFGNPVDASFATTLSGSTGFVDALGRPTTLGGGFVGGLGHHGVGQYYAHGWAQAEWGYQTADSSDDEHTYTVTDYVTEEY